MNNYCRVLDKYFGSFYTAKHDQNKKYKSLVQTIANLSSTKKMTQEEQEFFKTNAESKKQVVAINVILFLIKSGCIQISENVGQVLVNHVESEI